MLQAVFVQRCSLFLKKWELCPKTAGGRWGGQGEQWELLPPACDPVWGVAYVL